MVNQDRLKQERLLNLAGWLHHKHQFQTRTAPGGVTEFRFTRDVLGLVDAFAMYSTDAGDAGERALLRDLEELRSFGIDVEWEAETQQWLSRAAPLTDDECRALATAALYVLVEDGTEGPGGYHVPGAGLSVTGAEVIVAYAPIVDVLIESIGERQSVRILRRNSKRTVDPWHVFLASGRWYLIGHDHRSDERRVFSIESISDVQPDGETDAYAVPQVDFEALARAALDPDSWTDSDPFLVTLEVDPRVAGRAESLLGAERLDTEEGGRLLMGCRVRSVDAFLHRLWGLRARAIVLAPDWLRERVVAELKAMS